MVVWGGYGCFNPPSCTITLILQTGGQYDPVGDSWTATTTTDAPTGRYDFTTVWTGSEMIIWGGFYSVYQQSGGRYAPALDQWASGGTSLVDAPLGRYGHASVWTGSRMIVWGGQTGSDVFTDTGGIYDPATNSWEPAGTGIDADTPSARRFHGGIWTGREMLVWGGRDGSPYADTGGRYAPGTNSWDPLPAGSGLVARERAYTLWTGADMLIWGGIGEGPFGPASYSYLNTGALFDPDTDLWRSMTSINAPTGRYLGNAVTSGDTFMIWDGRSSQDGGIYYIDTAPLARPHLTEGGLRSIAVRTRLPRSRRGLRFGRPTERQGLNHQWPGA